MCHLIVNKGFRQGSPEASWCFALIVCHLLACLDRKWKANGCGVVFGKWGGSEGAFSDWWDAHSALFSMHHGIDVQDIFVSTLGFLDDIYFTCTSTAQAQCMLDDAIHIFASVGLKLNISKIKWMANKYVICADSDALYIDKIAILRSSDLIVLGCLILPDGGEGPALRHRMAKAWGVFHKWAHILTCNASIEARAAFWGRVVLPSLTWGTQTLRKPSDANLKAIGFCQKLMFRKMARIGRRKIGNDMEDWLEWHKRSLDDAKNIAIKAGVWVVSTMAEARNKWAGHIARMGMDSKPPHLLKYVIGWRPLEWWRGQQLYNLTSYQTLHHPFGWGLPRRWENHLVEDWWIHSNH